MAIMLITAAVVLMAWIYFRSSPKSGFGATAATIDEACRTVNSENAVDSPQFSLCHPGVAPIIVEDDQMDWFEDSVIDIYNLTVSEWPHSTPREHEEHARLIDRRVVREGLESLRALTAERRVESDRSGWRLHEPLDDIVFARALVAADFDIDRAFDTVKTYSLWRQKEIKGGVPPSRRWLTLQLAGFSFYDKVGRPVIVIKLRNFVRSTPLSVFEEFYRGIVDAVIAHMLLARSKSGGISKTNPLEQYTLVMDTTGAGRQNFSLEAVKMMVHEGKVHYADRLAQVVVLGTGFLVESLWSIASPLIHPRTRKKVRMVSTADVRQFMRTLVDEDVLPMEWGGRASDNLPYMGITSTSAGTHFDFRSLAESAGRLSLEVWQQARVLKDAACMKPVDRDAIPTAIQPWYALGLGCLCLCRVHDADDNSPDCYSNKAA
jgi:hypothetical protein